MHIGIVYTYLIPPVTLQYSWCWSSNNTGMPAAAIHPTSLKPESAPTFQRPPPPPPPPPPAPSVHTLESQVPSAADMTEV
jgi:hypothetical protein